MRTTLWEALVELDRTRPRLGDQLVAGLRAAIAQGRLAAGTRMPSTRRLAADLGVSRGVVVDAYDQLVAEGWFVAKHGAGTAVTEASTAGTAMKPSTAEAANLPTDSRVQPATGAHTVTHTVAHTGVHTGAHTVTTTVTPLRPGVPNLRDFPRAAWRRAYERALNMAPDTDLDYGDPAGAPRLRAALAGYLGRVRAARAGADSVIVTSGATQAFALLATVLRERGVTQIGFEDPGPAAVREHLAGLGVEPVPIPVDESGLDVGALARTRLTAVLVTPAHQFPTGVVLAPQRRAALVGWARRVDGLVVEDDYDAEFRYDREPVGCLHGLAPDRVVLVGSVSKALAPAMRIGWLVAPDAWRSPLRAAKTAADHGGPTLELLAFAEFLTSGGYDRHLRRVRRLHRERRDALVAAVRRHLPDARIDGIAAGLHLVVRLPDGVDDAALAARATDAGLGPLALSALRLRPGGAPGLVLGYAAQTPAELTRAVRVLARLAR